MRMAVQRDGREPRTRHEPDPTGAVGRSQVWTRIETARGGLDSWNAAIDAYPRFERVKRLVEREPMTVSVADAAAEAAFSEAGFSRAFHELIGVSYRDWRRVVMVSRALVLLEKESRSMPQVARAAGFGSVRSFQRAFARVVGVSPIQHRQLVRATRRSQVEGPG